MDVNQYLKPRTGSCATYHNKSTLEMLLRVWKGAIIPLGGPVLSQGLPVRQAVKAEASTVKYKEARSQGSQETSSSWGS